MPNIERIFQPLASAISIAISAILMFCSLHFFPIFFESGIGFRAGQPILEIALTIGVLGVSAILLSLLFANTGTKRTQFSRTLVSVLVIGVLGIIAAVLLSAIYGYLAVWIYSISENRLDFPQIKGVIDATTGILTLLVIPIFLHILFHTGFRERGRLSSLRNSFRHLRKMYRRVLLLLSALFSCGYLICLPFSNSTSVVATAVQSILLGLVGTCGILLLRGLYVNGTTNPVRAPQLPTEDSGDSASEEATQGSAVRTNTPQTTRRQGSPALEYPSQTASSTQTTASFEPTETTPTDRKSTRLNSSH